MYEQLALLGGFVLVYSVVARGLERTWITGPMVFLAFGVAVGPLGLGLFRVGADAEDLKGLAELALALTLFSDAAGVNLGALERGRRLPIRLLAIGLPLTILLGLLLGGVLFAQWTLFEIALLATILAPTDAALGKGVVTNPAVPAPIRQALNVESGLNDGICVPVIFLLLALVSGSASEQGTALTGLRLLVGEVGIGLVVGAALSSVGVWMMAESARREWLSPTWRSIAVVALAFTCFAVAQLLGGSGFIACFVGGLLFGTRAKDHRERLLAEGEGIGDTLALATWVLFGAAVVSPALGHFQWIMLLYAVLSLTVVRMIPVFLATAGLGLGTESRLFMGWFGPRGLASIVFIVIVAAEKLPHVREMVLVVVLTITIGVVAHGVTASPWAKAFGRRSAERTRA